MTSGIGHQNLAKTATITATSYETALPPDNVAGDTGAASAGWQTLSGVTTATLTITMESSGSLVNAVHLARTNLTAQAQITVTIIYSSGTVWTGTLSGPDAGYGQVLALADATYYCDSITIEIDDPTNTDGFLNVALVWCGELWFPTYPIGRDSAPDWEDDTTERQSRGGSEYPNNNWVRRIYKFDLQAVTDTEAYQNVMEIDRLSRLGGNILFVPDTESEELNRDAILGRLRETSDINSRLGAVRMKSWSGVVRESI